MKKDYSTILDFYKKLLDKEGLNLKGLGWNSKKKNKLKFDYLFEIISFSFEKKFTLLDFGCGISNLYHFLKTKKIKLIYEGLDVSKKAISYSSSKFKKNKYHQMDILKNTSFQKKFDVVVLNGIFTIKNSLTDKQMYNYIFKVLARLKKNCKGIMIINFLTSNPDWKNSKNFYPSIDKTLKFVHKKISKNYGYFHSKELHEGFLVIKFKK